MSEGKKLSDKVEADWQKIGALRQKQLQERLHETFEFLAPDNDNLRNVVAAYVNQLEEVKEDSDVCYCGKDKG